MTLVAFMKMCSEDADQLLTFLPITVLKRAGGKLHQRAPFIWPQREDSLQCRVKLSLSESLGIYTKLKGK